MYVLDLPDDVLEKILNNLSYDEVSHCRLVSQRFNEISKRVLNHGFIKVERFHLQCLKSVKSQLPRRESERRNHPLARHCDILTAIETRLSLLSSTFKKFIDLNICCFIPGKVLDEIFRVLRYVTTAQTPIRTHDVLQELRDLSSMAMEYFDEKIAPALKTKHKETGPKINILCSTVKHLRPNTLPPMYKLGRFVNELAKRHNNVLAEVASLQTKKKELENIGKRIADLEQFATECKKKLSESEKIVAEQQITISQQEVKLHDQEIKIELLCKLIGKQESGSDSSGKSQGANNKRKRNVSHSKRICSEGSSKQNRAANKKRKQSQARCKSSGESLSQNLEISNKRKQNNNKWTGKIELNKLTVQNSQKGLQRAVKRKLIESEKVKKDVRGGKRSKSS